MQLPVRQTAGREVQLNKILARAKSLQPQKWPPESVIDLTCESDNDDNTVVSLHSKREGGLKSYKSNAVPLIGSF